MNLTAEQIQYTHDFVKRKYVDYYDVQIELVDHIATSIEEKIEANPKLDFYTALQQVSDSFGMFGFMKFVEEKEKQVQRRFRKMYQREVRQFFTIPKVLFTIAVVFVVYQFNSVVSYEVGRNVTLVLLFSLVGFQLVYYYYQKRKLNHDFITSKSPLIGIQVFNIANQALGLFAYRTLYEDSIWWIVVLTTGIIIGNIANYTVGQKMMNEQRRLYPEAFAV